MNAYYVPGTVSNLTYLIFKAYFRDSMDIFYSKKKRLEELAQSHTVSRRSRNQI